MVFVGSQQEGPFVYTTADLYNHFVYDGNNPGTDGSLRQVNKPVGEKGFYDIWNTSEGWIASMNNQGNGVVLLSQHNTRYMGGQFNEWDGDQDSNASSYINGAQMLNFDVRTTYAFGGYIYAGSMSNFRQWYKNNRSNIKRTDFSWTFGKNITCGWWSGNGPAKFVNDRYTSYIGTRKNDPGAPDGGSIYRANADFCSPFGTWKASDIPVVYIKFKFTGTKIRNLKFEWKKVGWDNSPTYSKEFTASNTTSEQTIALNMSGVDNWNDYIANVKICLKDISQDTDGTELFIPSYIGSVYPS